MILKRGVVIRIRGILGNGTIIDDFIFVGIDMVGIERGGIVEEGEMKRWGNYFDIIYIYIYILIDCYGLFIYLYIGIDNFIAIL